MIAGRFWGGKDGQWARRRAGRRRTPGGRHLGAAGPAPPPFRALCRAARTSLAPLGRLQGPAALPAQPNLAPPARDLQLRLGPRPTTMARPVFLVAAMAALALALLAATAAFTAAAAVPGAAAPTDLKPLLNPDDMEHNDGLGRCTGAVCQS